MKIDVDGERVNWLKIKCIQVRNDKEYSNFVKYGFDVSEFKEIRLMPKKSRSKDKSLKAPQKAYTEELPISAAEKADLMSLFAFGTFRKEYESY
jgi:hypothetical protein